MWNVCSEFLFWFKKRTWNGKGCSEWVFDWKEKSLGFAPRLQDVAPDSKTKAEQNKKTVDSLKSVLDKNLRNAESQKLPVDNISTDLEKEILKQIK